MVRESSWFRLLGPAVCLVLVLIFFGSVLFTQNQFSFRDAGHYYYPLYKLVQTRWSEGFWPPLWEPEENSGMPLLGNPTAAVLYPGKIIYGLFSYPVAAKIYIVGHSVLAFATMTLALRSWGMSVPASTIGSLSYAFGAPIVFQYCNIIFLVGAAWLPLGFRAVDRWLRLGNRWGLLELAIVLAMQTLGGDPQSSYLLGLSAAVYAVQLTWLAPGSKPVSVDLVKKKQASEPKRLPAMFWWLLAFGGVVIWVVVTIVLARILPDFRPKGPPPPKPLLAMRWAPTAVALGWAVVVVLWWKRSRDLGKRRILASMLAGLIGSAVLAGGLAAAQLLPVAEFTGRTNRAAEGGPHDIYPFSLEPFLLAQAVWPNVFGTHFPENTYWIEAFPWPAFRRTMWIPSLYIGGLSLILGLSALGFRGGPPWRGWLSGIVLCSVLASFGQYTSPLWITRAIDFTLKPELRNLLRTGDMKGLRNQGSHSPFGIGPIDKADVNPIRLDGYLRDGDGGFYWALSTFLPGFKQFRYPSKLLTFACFGMSVLAGLGWENLIRGDRRRLDRLVQGLIALTACLFFAALMSRGRFLALFGDDRAVSQWGPFEPSNAFRSLLMSLGHTLVLFWLAWGIFRIARKRPALAGSLAAALVAADLSVANSHLIISSPQALYEGVPEALQKIRDAEAAEPMDGPFRIHRMPIWNPPGWNNTASHNRAWDYTKWERDTIQPKYGITENVEYTQTIGVTELYDYEWFFGPFGRKARPDNAQLLHVDVGTEIVYFPRRSYDMWNTRYFIVPKFPNHWTDAGRGYASFLPGSTAVFPLSSVFEGKEGEKRLLEWTDNKDYQIFRNEMCYPRAWVVHDYRTIKGVSGMNRDNREGPMYEMVYQNDMFWTDSERTVFDPREVAWIDEDELVGLQEFRAQKPFGAKDSVRVHYTSPERVELDCNLASAGMVVLSDVYYPGWKLTVDGEPAPVYRANRLMRGAAVPAGTHKLVYTFEPMSFRIGLILSVVSIISAASLAVFFTARPATAEFARDTHTRGGSK